MMRNANHLAQSRDLLFACSACSLATNSTNLIQQNVPERKRAAQAFQSCIKKSELPAAAATEVLRKTSVILSALCGKCS